MMNWEAIVDRHVPIREAAAHGWQGMPGEVSPVDFLTLDRVEEAEDEVGRSPYGWRVRDRLRAVLRLLLYRVEVSSLFPVGDVVLLDAAEKYLWTAWLESLRVSCSRDYVDSLGGFYGYMWQRAICGQRVGSRFHFLKYYAVCLEQERDARRLADMEDLLAGEKLYWGLAGAALAGGVLVDVLSTLEAGVPLEYVVGE